MKAAATVLFYVWTGAAAVFGAVGLIAATWELPQFFHVALADMLPGERADLLNQYRFLRGVELGVGLLFLALRREVLNEPRFGWLFVVVVGAGALGRIAGVVLDGRPGLWMVALLIIELAALVAVALHLRALPARAHA
jgi:hypothetical protein